MSTKIDQVEIEKMHRWFAIEANNKGWALTSQQTRTAEEDEEMLHLAFVASHHWRQVGEPINFARADMLLAHACSHLRLPALALKYASRCHEFCSQNECADWDMAFATLELAYACAVAGKQQESQDYLQSARTAGEAIANPKDKEIFDAEMVLVEAELRKLSASLL